MGRLFDLSASTDLQEFKDEMVSLPFKLYCEFLFTFHVKGGAGKKLNALIRFMTVLKERQP